MEAKIKFSILTPFYIHSVNREEMLKRAVRSVINQTYPNWEHILVNDGSRLNFIYPQDSRQIPLNQEHKERLFAYNLGLKNVTGDWVCWLDSDDEYVSFYLETVAKMIEFYPESKLFNFGSIHVHKDGNVTLKPVFRPNKLEVGHEIFRSGTIVNGTFVFHRSLYDELGGFPEVTNCWDLATKIFEEFPETKEMYKRITDKGEVVYTEVGNPFGQDWAYFYKLTRKYHSQPVNTYLYLVHSKEGIQLVNK